MIEFRRIVSILFFTLIVRFFNGITLDKIGFLFLFFFMYAMDEIGLYLVNSLYTRRQCLYFSSPVYFIYCINIQMYMTKSFERYHTYRNPELTIKYAPLIMMFLRHYQRYHLTNRCRNIKNCIRTLFLTASSTHANIIFTTFDFGVVAFDFVIVISYVLSSCPPMYF